MTDSFNIGRKNSVSTTSKSPTRELNLDVEYIKCSTSALIREYLARKVF